MSDPRPFNLFPFVSVADTMKLVLDIGVQQMLCEIVDAIEADFRRWGPFDKTPRVAAHSKAGVIELMPTSDGQAHGFKYVNGQLRNTRSGRQIVAAFGVRAFVEFPEETPIEGEIQQIDANHPVTGQ